MNAREGGYDATRTWEDERAEGLSSARALGLTLVLLAAASLAGIAGIVVALVSR